jgi:hypothetical protein
MPFTLPDFSGRRPYLFHLTHARNLERIRREGRMLATCVICQLAKREEVLRSRRAVHTEVLVDGEPVHIRDQAPLHRGNMSLVGGWAFDDVLAAINERVFFWPGIRTSGRPISSGVNHFSRYSPEGPVLLRLDTAQMLNANGDNPPEFCRFNSGSPRWNRGRASPRGAGTFVRCEVAPFGIQEVVECTFRRTALLPAHLEVSRSVDGPWERIQL